MENNQGGRPRDVLWWRREKTKVHGTGSAVQYYSDAKMW